MLKLNARGLRTTPVNPDDVKSLPRNPISIVLDNVFDTYNVGSIFRLADAVAAQKVYLCGQTLTPPNSRIKKASVSTWQWVPWEYSPNTIDAIHVLRSQYPEIKIIAVEQSDQSKPFQSIDYAAPLAVVVGNESFGVSDEVLQTVDEIAEIPMWGVNKSLNVMVSCGIVLFEVMKKIYVK